MDKSLPLKTLCISIAPETSKNYRECTSNITLNTKNYQNQKALLILPF